MVYMSTGDGSPKVAVYGDLSTIDWIPTDFKKNVAYNLSPNKNITSLFLPHNIQLSEHDLNIPSLYDGISYVTWLENDYLTTGEYYFTSKQMLSDEKILKITNLFEEREFILKGLKLNDNIFKDHPLLTLGIFISILAIVLYSIRSVYELINLHPLLQQYWLYNATPIIIMKYFVCSIAILPLISSFIASSLVYTIEYEIFKSTPASNDYIIMFFSISAACLICNFIIFISYIHFVYQTAEKV